MSLENSIATILVIQDNLIDLEALYNMLINSGYKVLVDTDSELGIQQAKKNLPDLVLLDVMPKMSGFAACASLQSDPTTKDIPIIFITALSNSENKIKGLSLGAVDYISKPFQPAEVLLRIQIQLRLKRSYSKIVQQNQQLEQQLRTQAIELSRAQEDAKQAQLESIQNEKLSSIGQLTAEVAHEINNPIGFLASTVDHALIALQDLTNYIRLYQSGFPEANEEITQKAREIDLEYLLQDLPKMLASMQIGTQRIREISTSLSKFSRTEADVKMLADLHQGIDNTLIILQHRLKANKTRPAIQIIKKYGEIPLVKCYIGPLNQVFMNILANAIDALNESSLNQSQELEMTPGCITITTKLISSAVEIRIADNGPGMTAEVQSKLFDPFFTTKSIGQGTGLGLSISHQIVAKHRGVLECFSTLGKGTEFVIQIPLG